MDDRIDDKQSTQIIDYVEFFEKQFPYYLAIGMSYAEYWDGDPSLPRYYREAYQIKQKYDNYNMWLQGLYVYDAFGVVLYNAFRKKNAKTQNYPDKPYEFEKSSKKKEDIVKEEKAKAEVWMNNFVNANKKRK